VYFILTLKSVFSLCCRRFRETTQPRKYKDQGSHRWPYLIVEEEILRTGVLFGRCFCT